MSVLEAPQTWIAAAAVLVVIAVVLIALAPRRRRNAFVGSAGAPGTPGAASAAPDDDAVTTPVGPIAAPLDTGTAPAATGSDEAPRETGDWFRSAPAEHAVPDRADAGPADPARTVEPGDADEDVTGETVRVADPTPVPESAPEPAREPTPEPAAADPQPVRPTPRYVAVGDPARAGERAKDRLLAVLLADADGAVDVVAAMDEGGETSGSAAASLLRAGLTPAQVAELCGVDEGELATVVARDLGLLARSLRDQDGSSRTEEPGRAWASAGSAPASTTPTTG